MPIINNPELVPLIKSSYTRQDLQNIEAFLQKHNVLQFKSLPNGLFPAAALQDSAVYTGYASIWLRDNIHIAHAHHVVGKSSIAVKTINALLTYMKTQAPRFEKMIRGESNPNSVMNRPHVRFDGLKLSDIDQTWAHAQNDALGYFLWLYFKLAKEGIVVPQPADLQFLSLFPLYFNALQYWQDEDSGHWEETRKISASSIGVVVGALRMMRNFWTKQNLSGQYGLNTRTVTIETFDNLITRGEEALKNILLSECIQSAPTKARRYDGALLYLIYPLDVVNSKTAENIVSDVVANLQGEYGIRRYIGDSFWAPGYKSKLSEDQRTADFSNDLSARDAMLEKGQEALWCIFDPTLSAIYGRKYLATHKPEDLKLQTEYLNRSLGQITGTEGLQPTYSCPELYYIEDGKYVPSDATPLLWTQANLMIALWSMEKSLQAQN